MEETPNLPLPLSLNPGTLISNLLASSPPAGIFLIYFPHLFGLLHAAIRTQAPPLAVQQANGLLLVGSFFFSNAIHIWNDLLDADLDAQVERTRNRPIPRGAVSKRAAFIFTVSQTLLAGVLLAGFPGGFMETLAYALPNIVVAAYYPLAKRHTHVPQLVLGIWLAWGTVMGGLGLGLYPYVHDISAPQIDWATVYLVSASLIWAIIYDTLYAQQDLQADKKAGIKSLAVLLNGETKRLLWPLLAAMATLLVMCGRASELGTFYYVVSVGGAVGSLSLMLFKVDLKSSQSCWWWFSQGFWSVGVAISGGLLGEYYLQQKQLTSL
ncbi:UbiA prenyltransferase [Penicillium verhagenii]|nr:UbiA prenyltransferase [Penicillium verhagenii]